MLDDAPRWKKLAIVLAGYALALVVGVAGTALYDMRFSPADQQASGGMIAFGEMMFGAGVFAAIAALPTALALWFVRRHRGTWEFFTISALAFALMGVASVFVLLTSTVQTVVTPATAVLSVLAIAQMFGAPIWIGGFALFAWLAPARDLRQRMIVAIAIEIGIGISGYIHLLAPTHRW